MERDPLSPSTVGVDNLNRGDRTGVPASREEVDRMYNGARAFLAFRGQNNGNVVENLFSLNFIFPIVNFVSAL